jgi:hypothetical protein
MWRSPKELEKMACNSLSNADIMSDMKTFTVRDMDRRPAEVLDACDKEGAVRIRRRNGHSYTVRPEQSGNAKASAAERERWLAEHVAWRKRQFPKRIAREQTALVDRLLAGE